MPALPKPAIEALCATAHPGCRLHRLRRLHGGHDATVHRVELLLPTGRLAVVLRRYRAETLAWNPHGPARLAQTLTAVAQAGLPTPRLLAAELDGRTLGVPALLLSYLSGRGELQPPKPQRYLRQLAALLAPIHAVPASLPGLAHLPPPPAQLESWLRAALTSPQLAADPDGAAFTRALESAAAAPASLLRSPSLVHGDYWAGNVLAQRGQLSAVIDWDQAALGSGGYDLGYCRVDLALLFGMEAARDFLAAYEQQSGNRIAPAALATWDLLAATRALPDGSGWLTGYHGLGRTDLHASLLGRRLRIFIKDALARSPS